MMGNPLVSVIIPAYNCEDFIQETIESVLCQTYQNIEIIVVDDGSTDNTGTVWQQYHQNEKIRWIRQENSGPGAARNKGIQAARGEYLAFVDADDSLTPKSVEKRMALLMEVEGLELVYSNYFVIRCQGRKAERFGENYLEKYRSMMHQLPLGVVFKGNRSEIFEIPFDMWTATILVGKDLMRRTGLFRTDISIGEDRDMWIRMSMNTGRIGYVRSPIACYNRFRSNLTKRDPVRYAMARRDLNYCFLKKYGGFGQGRVNKVIFEKLFWVYFDLGNYYLKSGMKLRAIEYFLKSMYFSPTKDLPYKKIISSLLPKILRERFKTGCKEVSPP